MQSRLLSAKTHSSPRRNPLPLSGASPPCPQPAFCLALCLRLSVSCEVRMTKSRWKVRAEKVLGARPGVMIFHAFRLPPPPDRGQSPVGGVPGAGRPLGQWGRGRFLPGGAAGSPGDRAPPVPDGSIRPTEELGGTPPTCQRQRGGRSCGDEGPQLEGSPRHEKQDAEQKNRSQNQINKILRDKAIPFCV